MPGVLPGVGPDEGPGAAGEAEVGGGIAAVAAGRGAEFGARAGGPTATGTDSVRPVSGPASTILPASIAVCFGLSFSLAILERSSAWVPLTALETESRELLNRDMVWFRPADQRDDGAFKQQTLVCSPSRCLTWLALQSHC
ncbi:hypothetical protein DPEC_G00161290 [Dallia pectoralis]|uniref:Uncharacterized protein n=1 Tax=Dallia pectoralis TaxID=75939 RepID=A0ACC2GFY9_DALPE|nr:hypothetical protein DPEC_G00161290 [Dallia pectoralis]